MALSILLVTKKVILLNVMYYLTSNQWIHEEIENKRKNMSLLIKDDDVLDKYNEI